MKVSATDGVFVSDVMVHIAILDANDNPPVCEKVGAENSSQVSLVHFLNNSVVQLVQILVMAFQL